MSREIALAAVAVTATLLQARQVADQGSLTLLNRAEAVARIRDLSCTVKVASFDLLIDDACELVYHQGGSTAATAALYAITAYRWYLDLQRTNPEYGVIGDLEIIHAHAEACRDLIESRPVSNDRLN